MTPDSFDIVVIGAGIAGASVAAELANAAQVLLVEMESHPGFHATGRSAAFYASSYGSPSVRSITRASESFYRDPPDGFSEVELLKPRDAVFIARKDQFSALQELKHEIPDLIPLDSEAVSTRVPLIRNAYVQAGLLDTRGGDLDVDAILQGYLKAFRRSGGTLLCNRPVKSMALNSGSWTLTIGDQEVQTPTVVNAAGAWADQVAISAGLLPLNLQPKKRTAVLLSQPAEYDISDWPLIIDVDEEFYFKPDAGKLLLSPADETPCIACDAQADELDIAIAVDRFEKAASMRVSRIEHKWAGLRTFAPDNEFVTGFDPRANGFFWLAGQGGYGVQSAPGLAKLASALITGASPGKMQEDLMSQRNTIDPARLID